MVALSVQQSFWSVFRKLRINIAVHIYVISERPGTTKTFAQNIFINMHLGSPTPARSKVMVCLPVRASFATCRVRQSIFTLQTVGTFANDCFACKSCSTSNALSRKIQVPSKFKCQFSTNPFMEKCMKPRSPSKYVKWLAEVLLSVEQTGPFKFQFSPQRCDRQNLNEKLFHLFVQNNELYYQVYLHTVGNICDSRGEVKEQSVINITSQLFTI